MDKHVINLPKFRVYYQRFLNLWCNTCEPRDRYQPTVPSCLQQSYPQVQVRHRTGSLSTENELYFIFTLVVITEIFPTLNTQCAQLKYFNRHNGFFINVFLVIPLQVTWKYMEINFAHLKESIKTYKRSNQFWTHRGFWWHHAVIKHLNFFCSSVHIQKLGM